MRSCEILKVLNVEQLLQIERYQLICFGPYVQKSPTNIEEARALLAAPNGKRPGRRPKPRWGDYTSELAWSRLGVEPSELSEIVVDREVFPVLLVLLPLQSFPEVKQASK